MLKKQLLALYTLFANHELCAHRLTVSVCWGVFIAFSPFVGLHTVMVFFFGWLFSLHTSVLLIVSMFINNPWTMIAIYGIDHWFGKILCDFFGIDHTFFAPTFLQSWNQWLFSYLAMTEFSLGAFLFGGNVLGFACALLSYPVVKFGVIRYIRMKNHFLKKKEKISIQSIGHNENNSA
jgi:uncharacterized protein (DUF2062 family)